MRVLKALLFLIPLIVLGVILAVGILDNKTVKRNLVELANKKIRKSIKFLWSKKDYKGGLRARK